MIDPQMQALQSMMAGGQSAPAASLPAPMAEATGEVEGPQHEMDEGEAPEDLLVELQNIAAELQTVAPRLAQRLTAVTQIIFGD
jgi:hypothetical protein